MTFPDIPNEDPRRLTCPDALIRAENLFRGLFVVETSVLEPAAFIEQVESVEIVGDDAIIRFRSGNETTTSIGNTFITLGTELRIK